MSIMKSQLHQALALPDVLYVTGIEDDENEIRVPDKTIRILFTIILVQFFFKFSSIKTSR